MKAMPLEIVVLDERKASKSFAQKMYPVLHDLHPRQRLSMREASGDTTPEALLQWATFLEPNMVKVCSSASACRTAKPGCLALRPMMVLARAQNCKRAVRKKRLAWDARMHISLGIISKPVSWARKPNATR